MYVSYAEFQIARPDSDLTEPDFNIFVDIGDSVIDRLTMNKINIFGLTNFSTDTQDRIKKTSICQVDLLDSQGGLDAINGFSDAVSGGVKIGRYSESGGGSKTGQGNGIQVVDGVPVSPMIKMYLQPTGLLNRAINIPYTLESFN